MRAFIIVTLILHLAAVCVRAGGEAGAYERIFIYYAYQIDRLMPAAMRIFQECFSGYCTFSEMWNTADVKNTNWLPDGVDPKTRTPPIELTKEHIMNQGLQRQNINLAMIMKDENMSIFSKAIGELGTMIGNAKGTLPEDVIRDNYELFINSEASLREALALRTFEYHDYLYRNDIQATWENQGITVLETKDHLGRDIFDLKGSEKLEANKHLGTPRQVGKRIKDAMRRFGVDNPSATGHYKMVSAEIWSLEESNQGRLKKDEECK